MLSVDLYAPTKSAAELKAEPFQACFGDGSPAIVVVTSARDGVATLSVPVPDQVFSGYAHWNNISFRVLGTTDGMLSAPVEIRIGNPYAAAAISVGIATTILFLLAYYTEKWSETKPPTNWSLPRLFVGQDGEPSLSLFQMYIWTGLVVAGMIYVFSMSGDLLNVSEQVLVLLGLAGLSSISSRFVGADTAGTTPGTGHGFWGMFLVGGKPDLLRLQLFIFTLAIWVYVAVRVFYEQSFPELDANVLLLMGISNGVYVGAKWAAGGDPLAQLRKLQLDRDVLQEQTRLAEDRKKTADDAVARLPPAASRSPEEKRTAEAEQSKADAAATELDKLKPQLNDAQETYSAELARLSKLPASGEATTANQ